MEFQGQLLERVAESKELWPFFEYQLCFWCFNIGYFIYFLQKILRPITCYIIILILQMGKRKARKDDVNPAKSHRQ